MNSINPSANQTATQIDHLPVDSATTKTVPDAVVSVVNGDVVDAEAPSLGRLSYKFQRLREKLREAIASGELNGRLPGERQLARKFRVNAKTLSKALTDLAAEGLLDRSIGRGTFVKGSETSAATPDKWLVICDGEQADCAVVQLILRANPEAQAVTGLPPQRPSFLNPFKAAIIFSQSVPDAFVRDLVVRNTAVVVAGREPSTYSTHAVLIDRSHGASCIARDLMLGGHRRFLAVEAKGSTQLATTIRQAAARYAPESTVEPAFIGEVATAIEQGATAIICDSFDTAHAVQDSLERLNIDLPSSVSLAAVGPASGDCRCSGYVVHAQQEADAIIGLLKDTSAKRPTTLWLAAKAVDHGTTGPVTSMIDPTSASLRYNSVPA